MVNFCSKCGEKNNPDDRFCKNCGKNLIESTGALKEESKPQETLAPAKISPKSEPPVAIQIIKACIQILILGLVLYWVWYSYNCAVGNYPNTGDQMCKSLYQTFNSDGNKNKDGGYDGCTPTGCPSYMPWYGCGTCWLTSNLCHTRGTSNSSDDCSVCRKCP